MGGRTLLALDDNGLFLFAKAELPAVSERYSLKWKQIDFERR